MDGNRRNPFGRIIATVVRHEDLPLVSSDGALAALGIRRLWD